MPLDWLNTPLDADLGELIARKKKNRVIEALRQQVQGRMAPSVNVRLQLADLLIQAGRGLEAVPVLTGLSDEFARDGFVAKAIAILKRIERVEPGRADVQARLELLVQEQRRAATGLPAPRSRRGLPELGIEDIGDERAPHPSVLAAPRPVPAAVPEVVEIAPTELAAVESAPVEVISEPVVTIEPEALTPEPAGPEPVGAVEAAPEVVEIDEVEAASVLASEPVVDAPVLEPAAPIAPANPSVRNRLRRAFWRFLQTLPGSETSTSPPVPLDVPVSEGSEVAPVPVPEDAAVSPLPEPVDSSPEPVVEAEPTVEPEPEPKTEAETEPEPEPEPVTVSEPETSPHPTLLPEPEPEVEPVLTASEPTSEPTSEPVPPLSDEAFQEQLLDIVEDVLRAPTSSPAAMPRVELPGRGQTLDLARRLLASRLLHELAEDELLAVVRGLRLHTLAPGDVVVSEGEPGQGLFLITTGRVKVFVANPDGRNFEVAMLGEGDFFGEISSLSGRPRTATVVAAEACELLELDRPTLDGIARTHPRVREVLESSYIDRASSPEVAAVRAVTVPDEDSRRKAIEVLEAHFGESRWDPRMRLRLAELLLKAGKDRDAADILIGLADDLAKEGFPDKAIAILKKVEKLQRRNVEVVNLAPLANVRATPRRGRRKPARAPAASAVDARRHPLTDDRLHGWIVELVRHTVSPPSSPTAADVPREASRSLRAYGPGLVANPLFEDFTDDELVALIQGLRLLTFDAGDVVVSEGETGQSVFILTTGRVKVFVRAPDRRNVVVGTLGEGTFFGEISILSGNPRSATVVAAEHSEMLELDRAALDRIAERHPRVRHVLEEYSAARTADPDARRAREGASG